jgi:hypothetical protein
MKIAQMLPKFVVTAVFLAASFSTVDAAVVKSSAKNVIASESVGQTAVRTGPAPKATVATVVNGKQVLTNVSAPVVVPAAAKAAVVTTSTTIQSTVLIFARDSVSAYSAFSGLNAYGIPYQVVVVPQAGITLPVLNSSATAGNYGAIVILSEVSYDYGGTLGYQSALNTTQLAQIYAYQAHFGVRLVRLDSFPSPDSGTVALGGCCNTGQEQNISISNAAAFPTAGLIVSVPSLSLPDYEQSVNTITPEGLPSARWGYGTILRASQTRASQLNLRSSRQLQASLLLLPLLLSTLILADNR